MPIRLPNFQTIKLLAPYLAVAPQCCNKKLDTIDPFIVPPTWNKGSYHKALKPVWQTAASRLAAATKVYVIGYSLPDSDLFFRYLFALGSVGKEVLERFWVFNPDPEVSERFENLLGPGARRRYRYFKQNFNEALRVIAEDP
jgi:hypothetical protein